MAVRKLNPVTPGTRHKVITDFEGITTNVPEPSLTQGRVKSGGRNNQGKMTMRYIGGGHKQRYRSIDSKRDKHGINGTVKTIEYDPNRSARIALIQYPDGEKRYILAPAGLKVGQTIQNGKGVPPEVGNALPLGEIPLGTLVHNVELQPGKGGSFARSAISVASGSLVCTYPQRLQMRWTCVSTQMPGKPKPAVSTRLAVLRPTPGSASSASRSGGTWPPWRSSSSAHTWRMLRALVR